MAYRIYWSDSPTTSHRQDVDSAGEDKGKSAAETMYKQLVAGIDLSTMVYGALHYSVALVKVDAEGKESGYWFWQNPDWVAPVVEPVVQTVYVVYHMVYSEAYAIATTFYTGTHDQVAQQAKTFYDACLNKTIHVVDTGVGGVPVYPKTTHSERTYDQVSMWDETPGSKASLIEGWDKNYNGENKDDKYANPFTATPSTTPPVKEEKKTEDKKKDTSGLAGGAGGIIDTVTALKDAMDKTLESFKQRVTDPGYAGGAITQAAADEMADAVKVAFAPIADELAKSFQQSISDALKGLNLGSVAADLNPVTWLQKWWEGVRQTFATMLVGGVIIIIIGATVYYLWKKSSPEAQMNELFRMQMQQQIIKGMEWSRTPEGGQVIGQATGVAAGTAAKVLI